MQLAVPQATLVAACVQAPPPLQVPVLPQVPLPPHWPDGAGVPAEIGAQLPRPLTLQAWQVPQGPAAAADAVGAEAADALAGGRAGLAVRLERAALGRARALAGEGRDAVAVRGAGRLAGSCCRRRRAGSWTWRAPHRPPCRCSARRGVKVEPVQAAVPQETLVPPAGRRPRRCRRRCCRRAGWRRTGRAARGCRPRRWRSCPRCR